MRSLMLTAAVFLAALSAGFSEATAPTFQVTMYSDGRSCPGDCDATVVFQARHNGTVDAFAPPIANRALADPPACIVGQTCMICFDSTDASCIEVMYRGNGPAPRRFDFTPAFFEENCSRADLPQ